MNDKRIQCDVYYSEINFENGSISFELAILIRSNSRLYLETIKSVAFVYCFKILSNVLSLRNLVKNPHANFSIASIHWSSSE